MRTDAPTKTNLIRLRDELEFARMGQELLDQKRNILIIELLHIVDQTVEYQDKVDKSLDEAFRRLEDAVLSMGRLKLGNLASAIAVQSSITLKHRRVMGVSLPVVDTSFNSAGPYYGPMGNSASIDATTLAFGSALEKLGKLAELKVSISRLAKEVQKTIRKVNALEKVAIPDLEETIHYIQNRLEESERDMFVLMKTVKDRLAKKNIGEVENDKID